jgi:uncharacterized membrane protein
MSIGGLSVFILIVVGVVLVFLGARLFKAAYRRNTKGEGGGADDGSGGVSTEKRLEREGDVLRSFAPLIGGALAALGLLMGLAGALTSTHEMFLDSAVPATFMGITFGIVGFFLGARKLGRAAAIFSAVAMIFALGVSQGYVPGLEQTDHVLPEVEPRSEGS